MAKCPICERYYPGIGFHGPGRRDKVLYWCPQCSAVFDCHHKVYPADSIDFAGARPGFLRAGRLKAAKSSQITETRSETMFEVSKAELYRASIVKASEDLELMLKNPPKAEVGDLIFLVTMGGDLCIRKNGSSGSEITITADELSVLQNFIGEYFNC